MNPGDIKVLLISSSDPLKGGGQVGFDYFTAYKQYGFKTDFLTLYPVEGHDEILYVKRKKKQSKVHKIINILEKIYIKLFFRQKPGYYFFYKKEENPPISNFDLLKSINKDYDIVVILSWQEMLSFSSIKAIYEKLHCKFHFLGVDYSQMSGGCHFVGDCEEYKTGCKRCSAVTPILFNNFAGKNVQYRKKIYDEIKPIVGGNSYMINEFYSKSYLLKNARIVLTDAIINLEKFKPYDQDSIRRKLEFPTDKTFYILFGAQSLNDTRKGIKYILEALYLFFNKITVEERKKICVVTIGNAFPEITNVIAFDNINLGYVSQDRLIEVYAAADVFLCSSINDAGPIMINQSQSCGTPVVAFEVGGALDCIKNKDTGYCAKLKDSKDFANGIQYIYNLGNNARAILRKRNREYAVSHYSFRAAGERLYSLYKKYHNDGPKQD